MLIRCFYLLFGKRTSWRLGRALYRLARGDVANNISTNGEMMVQRCVVDGWKRETASRKRLVVFDVGANVGDWSNPILHYMNAPHEHALLDLYMFEPVPETFEVLRGNILPVGSGAALYFNQLALSSEEGTERMYIRGMAGTNSLHPQVQGNNASSISIAKDTVCHFCMINEIDGIHLLKCDTEGHDMAVIQGALPYLNNNKIKVLQFEYNNFWIYSRHYLKDVFDTVAGLPYRVGKIQSDHIELYTDWHPEMERFFEANYLLIHQDALPWFSTRETIMDKYNTLVLSSS